MQSKITPWQGARVRGTLMSRIGFALSRGLPPAEVVECVKLAEELGYESAWVAEGHGGDQFAILSACAAVTQRLRAQHSHYCHGRGHCRPYLAGALHPGPGIQPSGPSRA
jgi:hypothetical protein